MSGEEEWEVPIGLTKEHAICVDDSDDDEEAVDGVAGLGGCVDENEARRKIDNSLPLQNDSRVDIATSHEEENQCVFTTDINSKVPLGGSNVDVLSKISCDAKDMCTEGVAEAEKQPSAAEQPSTNNKETDDIAQSVNPFASFAFVGGEAASTSSSSSSWRTKKHTTSTNKSLSKQPITIKRKNDTNNSSSSVTTKKRKAQALSHPFFSKTAITQNNTIRITKNPLSIRETAESKQNEKIERQILISKWHSFADPNAPIEQRRFQVLVAARLHARCQEPVVLKAMDKLRTYLDGKSMSDSKSGGDVHALGGQGQQTLATQQQSIQPNETSMQGLTVHSLASSNAETEIAPLLSSVLFGNTKANQIVQAAKDVLSKFVY